MALALKREVGPVSAAGVRVTRAVGAGTSCCHPSLIATQLALWSAPAANPVTDPTKVTTRDGIDVFATLVLQGLSLPALIRWLGIEDDGAIEKEEREADDDEAEAS